MPIWIRLLVAVVTAFEILLKFRRK